MHFKYQTQRRFRSWEATIRDQRTDIAVLLTRNPSLQSYWDEALALGHRKGRNDTSGETGLAVEAFSEECPYPYGQVVDDTFFPEGSG